MTTIDILEQSYKKATESLKDNFISDSTIFEKIVFIATNIQNRAVVRLLLSCVLAKIDNPKIDPRKPYTEIGTRDSFSGRTYDEQFVGPFISKYSLPCNPTTAFLTPALRNRNIVLTQKVNLVGRPPELYKYVLDVLDDLNQGTVGPKEVLNESIRQLILLREENNRRIQSLLSSISVSGGVPLSGEDIITLLQQHLKCKGASRLPVLAIAAVYKTIGSHMRERVLDLMSHTSADKQTGALGDVQVTIENESNIVTTFEMKSKKVTKEDINIALNKIIKAKNKLDNYIFITTDEIQNDVQDYAKSLYGQTGGVEIVILDCISFIRYFLHLFHRYRLGYLEEYQKLVLDEPDSAVIQPVKEAFLALRRAAESSE